MSVSIEKGVRDRIENPTPSEEVKLIVDLDEVNSPEKVVGDVEAVGESVKVEETLPFQCLAVSAREDDLEALSELRCISRIEIEGSGKVLNSGN
ncbi:hypothetical protein ACFQH2_14065 [Natronoarchaeum sp. GCM10025703]|uniref:hypothetical protein n=1 Tax=unclassified Natronoarchaeum TaxID=2620183 RepID=UPI003608642F